MALKSFSCKLAITITALVIIFFFQGNYTSAYISKCQKVTISSCMDLNYNLTIFPNLLKHRRQEDAESDLKQYDLLVQSECSENLRFFLCVLFVPVCTILEKPLPPCRHLCTEVRSGCENLLKKYGFDWPENFQCKKFPAAEEDVCVAPNPTPSKTVKEKKRGWKDNSKNSVKDGIVEASEGQRVTIYCSGNGNTVHIRKVRHSGGSGCHGRNTRNALTSLCNGKKLCSFIINETTLGGKCSGKVGKSKIKYKCTRGGTKAISAKLGQSVALQCRGKREIRVVKASYGNVRCRTPHAHCMLSQLCNGNQTCNVKAEPGEMDSNCGGTATTLEAEYECVRRPDAPIQTASISGDKVLSIPSCPDKKKLSIIHAMYGKGGRCQMYCVVFALCHGKVSCIIPNMAQFRKSCPGSTTELKVRYQCV